LRNGVRIRPAEQTDVALLLSMITELADYDRAADQVSGTEDGLHSALFGPRPCAEAVIAEVDRAPAGFALFFPTFSTWLCQPSLHLEDLYLRPEYRGSGVGLALLSHLAGIAIERGCARLEWAVLGWNSPAIEFYERVGARHLDEWQTFRVSGPELAELARASDLADE
jgi:GNAT superfamily N-acetyltransferase